MGEGLDQNIQPLFATVALSGASGGTVNLDGRLDADLSGASKLEYIGNPTMGTINTSGGSTLNKK